MKSIMKNSGLLMLAVLGMSSKSAAQTGPEVCSIKYQYDIAGNRIKREYKCQASWTPGDIIAGQDRTIFRNLYPNPTTGVLTGVFTTPIGGEAGGAYVSVTTMSGIVVFEQAFNEIAGSVTFDIAQQMPGNYLVNVRAFNTEETYLITKL